MVDGQERGELLWAETAIGETLEFGCPCDRVTIPRRAMRVCSGDVATGGRWVDSDVTECQFDALTWDLCSAEVRAVVVTCC